MADNKTPREEKQKSYYSINLTEGRRFILFVVFIVVIVVIFIGVYFALTLNSKKNQVTNNSENKKPDNNLAYYYSLTNEERPTSIVLSDTTTDKSTINLVNNQSSIQTKVDQSEDMIKNKINEEPQNIDNSEIYYSSKFKTSDKNENIKSKYTQNKNSISKKTKFTETKTSKNTSKTKTSNLVTNNTKKITKRYVVQIGSYTNKKTAEEIASFYQNNGNYPTFVKDISSNGKTFYRLRVGPFTDKLRAEKYLSYLKDSKYGKSSYISEIYN